MNIRKIIVYGVRQACLCMAGLSLLLISDSIEAKAATYEYDDLNRVTKVPKKQYKKYKKLLKGKGQKKTVKIKKS